MTKAGMPQRPKEAPDQLPPYEMTKEDQKNEKSENWLEDYSYAIDKSTSDRRKANRCQLPTVYLLSDAFQLILPKMTCLKFRTKEARP